MRVKKILVPTDFSENSQLAFETAHRLARQLGAKLYLLHIQEGGALRVAVREQLLSKNSTDEQLQATLEQLIAERFSQMSARLRRSEVYIKCVSRRGSPKSAIVRFAQEMKADMIVIGMRGITAMSMVTSVAVGSVAEWVLRRSPCPTLIVRMEHRRNRIG